MPSEANATTSITLTDCQQQQEHAGLIGDADAGIADLSFMLREAFQTDLETGLVMHAAGSYRL